MSTNYDQQVFIIDCQLLQTKAWHRGMGKYTARTLEAWAGSAVLMEGTPSIKLLFNSKLPYHDELKDFVGGLNGMQAVFLELNVPNYEDLSSITIGQERNRQIIDTYIDDNHPACTVSFMITSLFLDEACPVFPTKAHKSLIYYDLIPLMYVKKYLGYGVSEQFFTRFSVLYEANMVFAISETVANDLTNFLGFPPERIVNILGASNQGLNHRHESKPNLPINRPFIIMPTGGDPRKNNAFGVKAFEKFNKEHNAAYQLVITSYFNDDQKEELNTLCDSLVFSDNVSDDELWWLYTHSEGMLFPSEYEGLGMPVLEAMDADKLVACSDIAVFREISEDAYFMFSPYSLDEAVAALYSLVHADDTVRSEKKKYYKKIQERYTWVNTATIIQGHMKSGEVSSTNDNASKPRLAIVCPHVSSTSEAGLWATNQYITLARNYQVDYFYEIAEKNRIVRPSYLSFVTNSYNILELSRDKYQDYDVVIYIYDGKERSSLEILAALGAPGAFVYGKNDLDHALDYLVEAGYMTPSRRRVVDLDVIKDRSQVYVDATASDKHNNGTKQRLSLNLPRLPYEQHRKVGGSRITLTMTGDDGDLLNAEYIQELYKKIESSHIEVDVISRSTIFAEARIMIESYPVEISEKMTDHEYLSALMRADLYIDCNIEESLERSIRIATAKNLSVPVLFASQTTSLQHILQQTYHWLVGHDLNESDTAEQEKSLSLSQIAELVTKNSQENKQ